MHSSLIFELFQLSRLPLTSFPAGEGNHGEGVWFKEKTIKRSRLLSRGQGYCKEVKAIVKRSRLLSRGKASIKATTEEYSS